MTTHVTATREKWLEARLDLLAAEKDLMRRSDDVARLRQRLPWVLIDKAYVFEGPDGRQTLADLFDTRHQLLVQHFMLKPGAEAGCRMRSGTWLTMVCRSAVVTRKLPLLPTLRSASEPRKFRLSRFC